MIILAILTRLIAADFQLPEAESLRLARSLEEVYFIIFRRQVLRSILHIIDSLVLNKSRVVF